MMTLAITFVLGFLTFPVTFLLLGWLISFIIEPFD